MTATETTMGALPAPAEYLPPSQAVVPAARAEVQVSDEMTVMPGVPGREEFLTLAMQARMLSLSGAAPEAIRESPHVAFHVAMVGRDLGISPSAAIALIDVINTSKGPTVSLSPQLLNGQVRRLGLGEVLPVERSDVRCIAAAIGPGGADRRCRVTGVLAHVPDCTCDVLGYTEFTWEDAQEAGLAGRNCQPGAHQVTKRQSRSGRSYDGCDCNQGYVTYPKRMLWWRASGFVVDDFFPEAGLGLYTAEELGAVVDVEGRPVDPSTVALPEGYDDPGEARRQRQAQKDQPADPDALWALQEQINALPPAQADRLRDAWKAEDSRLRGIPARLLPDRLLRTARAMANAYWGDAVKAGVNKDAEVDALRGNLIRGLAAWWGWIVAGAAPQTPQDATDPDPAPGHQDDPPQAQDATASPASDDPGADPETAADDLEQRARWQTAMAALSREVRDAAQGITEEAALALGEDIKAMHWQEVNKALTAAGMAEDYPPQSPIDLRRMALCLVRIRHAVAETT